MLLSRCCCRCCGVPGDALTHTSKLFVEGNVSNQLQSGKVRRTPGTSVTSQIREYRQSTTSPRPLTLFMPFSLKELTWGPSSVCCSTFYHEILAIPCTIKPVELNACVCAAADATTSDDCPSWYKHALVADYVVVVVIILKHGLARHSARFGCNRLGGGTRKLWIGGCASW